MNLASKKIYINCLFILIITIVIDQVTKYLAKTYLIDDPINVIENVFSFTYLENRGVGFGLLQNKMYLILIVNIIVICLIGFLFVRLPKQKRFVPIHVLITLIVSGALGNIIDRVRLGYVVDFFYFELIDFPIFNFADIYVTVSVFVMAFFLMFYYKPDELDAMICPGKSKKKEESVNEQ